MPRIVLAELRNDKLAVVFSDDVSERIINGLLYDDGVSGFSIKVSGKEYGLANSFVKSFK
jgi:hypothetical protein